MQTTIKTEKRETCGMRLLLSALIIISVWPTLSWAQDQTSMDGMGNIIADEPALMSSPAAVLYQEQCAACHDKPTGRTPPRASLRYRAPESIYQALTTGAMKSMTSDMDDNQVKSVVKYLTGREPKNIANPLDNKCEANPVVQVNNGDWLNTHGGVQSRRFRRLEGVEAASVGNLKLKWAYAYPGGAKGPVALAGDALFLAGTAYVVSLDKDSGCVRWAHSIGERTVRALTVAESDQSDSKTTKLIALYGDDASTLHALDANTGNKLWQTNLDSHVLGRITAAPTVHEGVAYVALSAMEDPLTHDPEYFCCSARGGVVAVDIATGELLWKKTHISEPLGEIVSNDVGGVDFAGHENHFKQGPAGASTYTPLTIDVDRGLVYASTAEEYGFTDASGPYSVIAYDLKTGQLAWQQSLLPSAETRQAICAQRETDCRNMFSTGTSVLLHTLGNGKDILVVGMKDGHVHALDPQNKGQRLWSTQVAEGGDLGGIMYGLAADNAKIYVPVADVDSTSGLFTGSLAALDPHSGIVIWRASAPKPACSWSKENCIGGQVAAATVVSDMIFTGFWDGYLRIYAADDGSLLREIDTAQTFSAVNGKASGGQVSGYPVTVGSDAIYVNSGASSIMKSGNALLVYTLNGE